MQTTTVADELLVIGNTSVAPQMVVPQNGTYTMILLIGTCQKRYR